ncbi:WhiB family transcriptional regulator [Angustibacter sp. McL0619]|uniref:WhiB family transcriptional regulator n=1 Tax=Angustibacter sp. McL0619 TaxID=3415676 RepID=UPI003CEB2631
MSVRRKKAVWPPAEVAMSRWVNKAACADLPQLPWTSDSDLVSQAEQDEMTSVCSECPVRARCAAAADRYEATAGFWGGLQRDTTDGVRWAAKMPAVSWAPHHNHHPVAAANARWWEQAAMIWADVPGVRPEPVEGPGDVPGDAVDGAA